MDNKKTYKRISTIFFFTLATLPLLITLIGFLGQYIGGVPNSLSGSIDTYYKDCSYYWLKGISFVRSFTPSFITNMFENLQDIIDDALDYDIMQFFAWFVWVYFLELIVDFVIWLPRFFHNILSKGVDKID